MAYWTTRYLVVCETGVEWCLRRGVERPSDAPLFRYHGGSLSWRACHKAFRCSACC